jgi:hypothetical protein
MTHTSIPTVCCCKPARLTSRAVDMLNELLMRSQKSFAKGGPSCAVGAPTRVAAHPGRDHT